MRHCKPARLDCGVQVDANDTTPILRLSLHERLVGRCTAPKVVHHDIDPPKLLGGLRDQHLGHARQRQVDRNRKGTPA